MRASLALQINVLFAAICQYLADKAKDVGFNLLVMEGASARMHCQQCPIG